MNREKKEKESDLYSCYKLFVGCIRVIYSIYILHLP